jgi:hypothetical protein
LLLAAILGGIILVGTAWEKSAPFVHIFNRASADAGEISKIRKEVEQQRDTIGVIAREANTAHAEMEQALLLSKEANASSDEAARKSEQITRLAKQATGGVERIKSTLDFSFLLAQASADDRKSFEELSKVAKDEDNQFHELALKAIIRIAGDLGSSLGSSVDWKRIGIDPATITFGDLKELFDTRPAFDKPGILAELWHQERFPKFDRLSFLYDVIKSTDSILVLNAACRAMNEECKINKNIIGYADYLKWWLDHAGEYARIENSSPLEKLELPLDSPVATPTPQPSSP